MYCLRDGRSAAPEIFSGAGRGSRRQAVIPYGTPEATEPTSGGPQLSRFCADRRLEPESSFVIPANGSSDLSTCRHSRPPGAASAASHRSNGPDCKSGKRRPGFQIPDDQHIPDDQTSHLQLSSFNLQLSTLNIQLPLQLKVQLARIVHVPAHVILQHSGAEVAQQ